MLLYELVPVLLMIAIPLSVNAGFFLSVFGEKAEAEAPEVVETSSAVDAPMLTSLQNPNPSGARGGGEVYVEDGALVSTGPVSDDDIAESEYKNGEISIYIVKPEDTLSHIADMFGVSINTIRWANDISGPIQPGDELLILPISGVQHTVEEGETLSTIVKKYEGDLEEVIEYNQLASADDISVGDTVVIPGGAIHRAAPARTYAAPTSVSGNRGGGGGFIDPLPAGLCTQGVHGYNGVDMGAPAGTPIRAAASGEVIVSKSSGWNGGYGLYVVIRHSNGTQTLYAHNSGNAVGVGQWVNQGQTVGYVGNTGRSTGNHLHFEVRGGYNPYCR